jgi:hypothetical protein
MIFPFILLLLFGIYLVYSGIVDSPPFQFKEDGGWEYSRFPNKYWAIAVGIVIIGGDTYYTFF